MNPALLPRLRSWLTTDPAVYEYRLSLSEVREIVAALEEAEQMKKQIEVDAFCAKLAETPARIGPPTNGCDI